MRRHPQKDFLFGTLIVLLFACGYCSKEKEDTFFTGLSCPRPCECKWKRGKETVSCQWAGYDNIPKMANSGTQVLHFAGNALSILPADIFAKSNLRNLQEINLASCGLRSVDRFAFREVTNLMNVDLGYNLLEAVPSESFVHMTQLRELRLSGNPLAEIGDRAFSALSHLIRLELSQCRIANIKPEAFVGLETLRWLKLDRNFLSTLSPVVVKPLENLHGMDLQDNPWDCSCWLRPVRLWLLGRNIPSAAPPQCASPPRLSLRYWDELSTNDFACHPILHKAELLGSSTNPIMLTCQVRGDPTPVIQWIWQGRTVRNGSSLNTNGSAIFVLDAGTANDGVARSDLLVRNADLDQLDGSEFTCVGINGAGQVSGKVLINVAKPVVTTLHKRVVATAAEEQSKAYVIVALGGGAVLLVTLFLFACGVYTLRQKQEEEENGSKRHLSQCAAPSDKVCKMSQGSLEYPSREKTHRPEIVGLTYGNMSEEKWEITSDDSNLEFNRCVGASKFEKQPFISPVVFNNSDPDGLNCSSSSSSRRVSSNSSIPEDQMETCIIQTTCISSSRSRDSDRTSVILQSHGSSQSCSLLIRGGNGRQSQNERQQMNQKSTGKNWRHSSPPMNYDNFSGGHADLEELKTSILELEARCVNGGAASERLFAPRVAMLKKRLEALGKRRTFDECSWKSNSWRGDKYV